MNDFNIYGNGQARGAKDALDTEQATGIINKCSDGVGR